MPKAYRATALATSCRPCNAIWRGSVGRWRMSTVAIAGVDSNAGSLNKGVGSNAIQVELDWTLPTRKIQGEFSLSKFSDLN